jgi:hypothetical protein
MKPLCTSKITRGIYHHPIKVSPFIRLGLNPSKCRMMDDAEYAFISTQRAVIEELQTKVGLMRSLLPVYQYVERHKFQ